MSWEDQGRQQHMWFGHGTAPATGKTAAPDPSVTDKTVEERAAGLAYSAIAALPAPLRVQAEAQYQHGTLPLLQEAIAAWIMGTAMDPATFASRFFGRGPDDPVARSLYAAAFGAATATSHDDNRAAGINVADAIKAVGVDQWPRFVADAAERSRDPATALAILKSRQPSDAIRPVYPVETIIDLIAGGAVGGIGALARALGRLIVRQALPENPPVASSTSAEGAVPAEKPSGPTTSTPEPAGPNAPPAPAAGNRAEFEEYKDGLRRNMGRPATTDSELSDIMDDNYKTTATVGSGSTAAAVRSELATGRPVGGKWHSLKARQQSIRLQSWLRTNPTASANDRAAAENVLRDLQNALRGK